MARHRGGIGRHWSDPQLERRDLLNGSGEVLNPALLGSPTAGDGNVFHHDGIDGLTLHKSFVNRLNDRLSNSQAQASRVTQAFQAFIADDRQLPVQPPAGSTGPTLPELLSNLQTQVDYALGHLEILTNRPRPSQATSLRVSPLAPEALIPFADAQIAELGNTLAAEPPVVGPGGTLQPADPTVAVNSAVNAILNALAESSVHPNLFTSPGDFYLSPDVTFTVDSSGAPAQAAVGYFIRGPHGVILPGATLHPHLSV